MSTALIFLNYCSPVDVNECESDSHNCSENGMCLNFPGGYTCSCAAGYTGDGFNCTSMFDSVTTCCEPVASFFGICSSFTMKCYCYLSG